MKTYLDQNEILLLEKAATNLRDRLLVRMLFHLGCRVSEALGLIVEDIDFKAGSVTIQHLKSRIKILCPFCNARLARSHTYCAACGKKVTEAITKAQGCRKVRTIPLDPETLKMLKEFIDRGSPVERDGKRYIFGITRNTAWRIVTGLARRAGLPNLVNPETGRVHNVSPHRLRDAFAVHAVKHDDSGDGLRMLQEHLGHSSFNTTARYRKVSGEEHRSWYNRLWNKGGEK